MTSPAPKIRKTVETLPPSLSMDDSSLIVQSLLHPRKSAYENVSQRKKRRLVNVTQGKFSVFPVPRAAAMSHRHRRRRREAQYDRMPLVSPFHGSLEGDIDDSWRPNMLMIRPKDRWRGLVNYVPWKLGDKVDGFGPPVGGGRRDKSLRNFVDNGRVKREEGSSCRLDHNGAGRAFTTVVVEGSGATREKGGVATHTGLLHGADDQAVQQPDPPTSMPSVVGTPFVGDGGTTVSGVGGGGGTGYRVRGSVGPSPRQVESVLHGVMDTLRKVREARLQMPFVGRQGARR